MNFCGILVRSTHNHSNCTGVASSLFHECIYILATHISGLWEVVSMNGHSNEELNVQQVDPSGYYCSSGRCLDQRKAIIFKLLRVGASLHVDDIVVSKEMNSSNQITQWCIGEIKTTFTEPVYQGGHVWVAGHAALPNTTPGQRDGTSWNFRKTVDCHDTTVFVRTLHPAAAARQSAQNQDTVGD